ncbi:hypothetical protein [Leptolyngbya sp. NIES-2104]|uniref:hypothetical protein n=1 Tax=Leptolyngbya sp. NIES-2104 TaxID=1552121 RepID=UPI0006ECCC79|nr:hypothetical protein [Leptolyngbya sp. NIES-2104]GAP97846.1 hypothetical protein NIES2104_43980 [Leptolyngbya sp. NIES-2104]
MEITTRIDPNHAAKLTFIQQQTQQNIAEILGQAIDLYYEQLKPTSTNALQAFEDAGLVGFIDADPTEPYQSVIQEYLSQKHQQGQA